MESYEGAVHTAKDAIILLEASRINVIPRVTRRLKEQERSQIKAGDVFIWNEKEAKMRRWTDGRSWSASRVTGSFLTYREMESETKSSDANIHHSNYTYKTDGLIKQSFSLTTLKGDKMHLISYTTTGSYTDSKFANKTPSTDPKFANIEIPKDIYPELNDSSNSGSERSPKVSKSHSSPSISIDSATPMSLYNTASTSQSVSPLPSPVNAQENVTQLKLTSPLLKLNTPRNFLDQPLVQPQQNTNNLPKLPPLRNYTMKPIEPLGRINPNSSNVSYDSVALNALDRLSFRF